MSKQSVTDQLYGPLKMSLKPVMDGTHLGTINVDAKLLEFHAMQKKCRDPPVFHAVLDRSGSMGTNCRTIIQQVMPAVARKLGVEAGQKIHIVAFDHVVESLHMDCAEMRSSPLQSRGGTSMAPAIVKLGREIMLQPHRNHRILVLSDGQLSDQQRTVDETSKLSQELKGLTRINCQAIRFFTYGHPDTRGLASCVTLNNVTDAKLIDISSSQPRDIIVDTIVNAFENDGLATATELECDGDFMSYGPWNSNPSKTIILKPGINYVWFKQRPTELKISGTSHKVEIEVSDKVVSLNDVTTTLKPLMDSYVARLKTLKVTNNQATCIEMKEMLEFFSRFETFLQQGDLSLMNLAKDHSIRSRIEYLRNIAVRRRQSLYGLMCEIANDEKVAQLSAAQQADYLRTVSSTTRNAKALARRALDSGLDFAGNLRKEIKNMSDHIDEIVSIDDTSHRVSFYSLETTLSGIKALCSLDDATLELMEATDLIQIANIVGCPTGSKIGQAPNIGMYPDPMTYRVDTCLPGVFISLSDVLVAYNQSNGQPLTAPGFPSMEIVNVIPVFDDSRIQRFFMKYAPILLEYTASIGMRRMIADVPFTYAYTLAAGAWKMVEEINDKQTTGNVDLLCSFSIDFHQAIHGHFDYLLDIYADRMNGVDGKSFFLNNNGITNCFSTILQLVNPLMLKNPAQHARGADNMPRILRALYSFEFYQAARRMFNKEKDRDGFITAYLHKLLGVDLELHATPLKPLYEPEPKPEDQKHYDQYTLDKRSFEDFKKSTYYVEYVTILPAALSCISKEDPVSYFLKNFRPTCPEVACKALGFSDDNLVNGSYEDTLDLFILANIVQGFMFPSKAERVDLDNKCMKIIDLATPQIQESLLRSYVSSQYANQYRKDCVVKSKEETENLIAEVVEDLLATPTGKDFCDMLVTGRVKGETSVLINSRSHKGYYPLLSGLMDLSKDIPFRLPKLAILVLGHNKKDEPVFNQGNVLHKGLDTIKEIFLNCGGQDELDQLLLRYRQFCKHTYRDAGKEKAIPNRHTHCTSKPSYFALGYRTLEDYTKDVTEDEFNDYCRLHWNCCGIPQARGLITRAKQRSSLVPPPDALYPE